MALPRQRLGLAQQEGSRADSRIALILSHLNAHGKDASQVSIECCRARDAPSLGKVVDVDSAVLEIKEGSVLTVIAFSCSFNLHREACVPSKVIFTVSLSPFTCRWVGLLAAEALNIC